MPYQPQENKYAHLVFQREERSAERRKKKPGGFNVPNNERSFFADQLSAATDRLVTERLQKRTLHGIKPHLVFRVPLIENASAFNVGELLEKVGVSVVEIESKSAIIAFKDDTDLSLFKEKIEVYRRGPREGINPKTKKPFQTTDSDAFGLINIQELRLLQKEDRIGKRLLEEIGEHAEDIEPAAKYTVEINLWHPGTEEAGRTKLGEVENFINQEPDARNLDRYLGKYLLLLKASVTGETLLLLLDLDDVAEIDLPPKAFFNPIEASRETKENYPSCPPPPENGPRLCILDSGITSNHPLLSQYVGHEEAILTNSSSTADESGHGTLVAGIAVYGDVRACYNNKRFASDITLFSARVLNEQNKFDDEKLIITQMQNAISTFTRAPYNCRVFNMSLGDGKPALGNGRDRQTDWAETLDTLARELGVLIIVSVGNSFNKITNDAEEAEFSLQNYPANLFDSDNRLCDPATSAIALTVGSLAQDDTVSVRLGSGKDDIIRPLAAKNQPSPITRIGPGLNGAIKPELVHYGGNLVFAGVGGSNRSIKKDEGTSIMSFSNQPTRTLFSYDTGTSFAAPQIARLAAKIEFDLKQSLGQTPNPNLVRAILANSASHPPEILDLFGNDKHLAMKSCGYGFPDEDFTMKSGDRRVTLIAEDKINIDHFQVFGIPIPDAFRSAKGKREIIISLAYDPPVKSRFDYLGVEMRIELIRGKSLEEVFQAFRKLAPTEEKSSFKGACRPDLSPKGTCQVGGYSRNKSTLQSCRFTIQRQDVKNYGDTYWLVVRAEGKSWVKETEQNFAVVVTLTADSPELYNQVRNRIRIKERIRPRVRS